MPGRIKVWENMIRLWWKKKLMNHQVELSGKIVIQSVTINVLFGNI